MPEDGKTATIERIKGRDYLLIDGYIAVRIDTLRELFVRPFNGWRRKQRERRDGKVRA